MPKKKSLSSREVEKLVNLYVEGFSVASISRELQRDRRSITKALNQHKDLLELARTVKKDLEYKIRFPAMKYVGRDRNGKIVSEYPVLNDSEISLMGHRNYLSHGRSRSGTVLSGSGTQEEKIQSHVKTHQPPVKEKAGSWSDDLFDLLVKLNSAKPQAKNLRENKMLTKSIHADLENLQKQNVNFTMLNLLSNLNRTPQNTYIMNHFSQKNDLSISDMFKIEVVVKSTLGQDVETIRRDTSSIINSISGLANRISRMELNQKVILDELQRIANSLPAT